jgi:hypothetical protein
MLLGRAVPPGGARGLAGGDLLGSLAGSSLLWGHLLWGHLVCGHLLWGNLL